MMRALQALASLTLLFLLGPLAVVVGGAFGRTSYLAFPPQGWTLHWFGVALTSPDYLRAFAASVELACLVTGASLLLGVSAAYALARARFPGRELVEALLTLPLVLPTLALAIAVTTLFGQIGLPPSLPRLAVAHMVICAPYVIRVVLPLLRGAAPALEEAARNLGAGPVSAVLLVTLPVIGSGLLAAAALSFIVSFDEFELAFFLSAPQAPTLPVLLYGQVEYGVGATVGAVAGLLIALAAMVMAVAQLLLRGRTA